MENKDIELKDVSAMAKVNNVWQISWLQEDGYNWYTYDVIGNRVVFYYEMTQKEMNVLLSRYYASRDARMSNRVEQIRTIIKTALI